MYSYFSTWFMEQGEQDKVVWPEFSFYPFELHLSSYGFRHWTVVLFVFLRHEVNYDKLIVVFNTDEWPLKGLLAISLDTSFCWRCSLKSENQLIGLGLIYTDFVHILLVFHMKIYYKCFVPNTKRRGLSEWHHLKCGKHPDRCNSATSFWVALILIRGGFCP